MTQQNRVRFELGNPTKIVRRENQTRRVLILANCSGDQSRQDNLRTRKIHPVDIDNFDDLLSEIAPRVHLTLGDTSNTEISIEFRQLDDFHPDTLFHNVSVFEALREMRKRLENPTTYEAATQELKRGLTDTLRPPFQSPEPAARRGSAASEHDMEEVSLFDRLLGKEVTAKEAPQVTHQDAIRQLINRFVEPYLAHGPDPDQQNQLISGIDDTIAQIMRRVLQHPAFQQLESIWRGIHWLISHCEDSEHVKFFLLDMSEEELAADLAQSKGTVEQTTIYKLFSQNSNAGAGDEPWSLIVGLYTFGGDTTSLDHLEFLGAVSAMCGAHLIAAADGALLGCSSLSENSNTSEWTEPAKDLTQRWQNLRNSRVAQSIGLAFPRFMLRPPYGEKSDPVETFRFEEIPTHAPPHHAYLWGNPALLCAALIAQAWLTEDERFVGTMTEMGDLPYHCYDDGEGQVMKPCAEIFINEKTAEAILDNGVMPLLSVRQRNCILLPRLISISKPPTNIC